MAELIPFEYRIRTLRRQQIKRWSFAAAVVAVISLGGVGAAFMWQQRCATEYQGLAAQYKEKSALIARSEDLRSRRQDLANRMQKIQQLMDDRTLLSLLSDISNGFSTKDCLDYISIDARAQKNGSPDANDSDGHYVVHIVGITENSRTLADLMTRLGKSTQPPVNVVLQSSKRESLMDGQVMHFEITCEEPESKGS
jgi:Tfp pilus assembly protein PilN